MAYNAELADRIRRELGGQPGIVEKKMFGGIGFIYQGNMACGVYQDDMIVRVSPQDNDAALSRPYARPMDINGRISRGWIMVAPPGVAGQADLASWVQQGLAYAAKLPPK